jgi:hypothetical protein
MCWAALFGRGSNTNASLTAEARLGIIDGPRRVNTNILLGGKLKVISQGCAYDNCSKKLICELPSRAQDSKTSAPSQRQDFDPSSSSPSCKTDCHFSLRYQHFPGKTARKMGNFVISSGGRREFRYKCQKFHTK